MNRLAWITTFVLTLALSASAQKEEVKLMTKVFYRVHLRNGNVIEGMSVRRDDKRERVTVRMESGEVTLKFSDLARTKEGAVFVEEVTIRERSEKPKIVEPDTTRTEPGKRTDERTDPTTTTKKTKPPSSGGGDKITWEPVNPNQPISTSKETRDKVDAILKELAGADVAKTDSIATQITGLPGAMEYLADLIDRVGLDMRSPIAFLIQRKPDADAARVLVDKLASKSAEIRAEVVRLLGMFGELGRPSAVRPLLRDTSPIVRAAAVQALREDADSLDALVQACADTDTSVSRSAGAAVKVLAEKAQRVDQTVDALISLARERSGKSRAEVVFTLYPFGHAQALPMLIEFLNDAEASVRANSAVALGELKSNDALDPLIGRLSQETESGVKIQIMQALGKTNNPKTAVLQALADQLDDKDIQVKARAGKVLQELTKQFTLGVDRQKWNDWIQANPGN